MRLCNAGDAADEALAMKSDWRNHSSDGANHNFAPSTQDSECEASTAHKDESAHAALQEDQRCIYAMKDTMDDSDQIDEVLASSRTVIGTEATVTSDGESKATNAFDSDVCIKAEGEEPISTSEHPESKAADVAKGDAGITADDVIDEERVETSEQPTSVTNAVANFFEDGERQRQRQARLRQAARRRR